MPTPPIEFGPLMENLDFKLSYLKITISELGLLMTWTSDWATSNQPTPSEWDLFIENLGLRFGYFKTPTPQWNFNITETRLV